MKPSVTADQSLAAALENEIPDYRLARTISEAMSATVTTRSGTLEPDFKTRLAAAQLALHYRHGRPVERQEILTVAVDADGSGMKERLAKSPALRKALREMLAESGEKAIDV